MLIFEEKKSDHIHQLFNMMANSKVFLDASIILFLNKTDIFAELCRRLITIIIIIRMCYLSNRRLPFHFSTNYNGTFQTMQCWCSCRIPIKTAFPDYTGKATYDDSLSFVQVPRSLFTIIDSLHSQVYLYLFWTCPSGSQVSILIILHR